MEIQLKIPRLQHQQLKREHNNQDKHADVNSKSYNNNNSSSQKSQQKMGYITCHQIQDLKWETLFSE